jgi:Bacterial Ig-like domain (group 3)/Right handed beta helix region
MSSQPSNARGDQWLRTSSSPEAASGGMTCRAHRVGERTPRRHVPELLRLENRELLATFKVTSTADDGSAGTLRQAIGLANAASTPSTIEFQLAGMPATITLAHSQLELSNTHAAITIEGPAADLLSISGDNDSRVLQVDDGVTAAISGLTITAGSSDIGAGVKNSGTITVDNCTISSNSSSASGGMYNGGTANLLNCTISGNSAGAGAGLYNGGVLTLQNSTIAGNFAFMYGGGLEASSFSLSMKLTNCTISGNTALAGDSGGIFSTGVGHLNATLTDTIVAGNIGSSGSESDLGLGIDVDGSYNLIGTSGPGLSLATHNLLNVANAGLAPLADNGGPTQTMALLAGSRAIGAGTAIAGLTTDQRGHPAQSPPDIGAYQTPITLSFGGLVNPTITYGAASVTFAGTLAKGAQAPPQSESLQVTLNGITHAAAFGAGGAFSTTFDTRALSAFGSTYTARFSYIGDGIYASASTTSALTVDKGTPTVNLTSSGNSAVFGQSVTFVAIVTDIGATPSGTVTFYDGANPLATVALDGFGRGTLTTTALAIGSHSITAGFSGGADFSSTTSGASAESVARAITRAVVVPKAGFKKKKLASLKLKAQIISAPPGAGTPTGIVTFEIQTTTTKKTTTKVLGSAALKYGSASLVVNPNKVLNKHVKIVYNGDVNFASSDADAPALTQASLKQLAQPMVASVAKDSGKKQ